jgi:hypothetical protein
MVALGGCAASGVDDSLDGGATDDVPTTGDSAASDLGTADAGVPPSDTGVPPSDTGLPPTDTGVPPTDTGVPPTDMGVPPSDTGVPPTDTGVPPTDMGFPPTDMGFPPTDMGVPPTDRGFPPTDMGVPPTDTGTTCPGGRALCAGVCVDPQSDSLNCGTCGRGCSVGEVCAAGACAMALRSVVISELRPANVPYVELFNGGNAPVDLAGYRVQWSTEMGGSGSVTLPTFALAPGAFVTLHSGTAAPAGALPLGATLSWTTNIAVRLLAPSGQGVDFVRTGVSTAAAPTGTTWTGPSAANPTADTDQVLVRAVYSPDTDSAADWTLRSASSPGSFCARPGRCGTACVDLDVDPVNCGACGYRCTGSQTCRSGVCVGGVGRPWISEYRLSGRPAVEIHNPSSRAVQLMGYRLQVAPVSGTTLSFFLPAFSLPPGGFVTVFSGAGANDATSIYADLTTGFGPNAAISLFDETSTGIDFVRVGTSAMAAPAGLSWFGNPVAAPSATADVSIKRDLAAFDTDSAADWSLSGPSTPGYLCNPGLTLCGGRCVDRALDRANCGACGTACGPQQTCIAGACRSVGALVFSELAAGTQSFELFNGTAASIDLSGYILDWVADGGSATYTIPSGITVASGAFVRFRPGSGSATGSDIAMGAAVAVNWSTFVAVSIRTGSNVGIDFVKTGASPTPAPSGTTWSGATATNPSRATSESLVRNLWAADTNTAADWSITATATPLSYCPSPTSSTVLCGTACVDTQRSAAHCGACGNTCNSAYCGGGQCNGAPALYHGWSSPIAGCLTGGYNATAATSLGGVYPYNVGDSPACRAWKLAATVCNSQPTQYVDADNWQCPSSGGFTDPVFGTYCAVASQYSCSTCPGYCNAGNCSYGPISLRNCAGQETRQP